MIAEDGNVIPGVAAAGTATTAAAPRVQTDVFMAAGKTFDVMINVPAVPSGGTVPPSLPVYDRELSLSANSSARDSGMLAYIGVNGSGLPVAAGTGIFAAAVARPDVYDALAPCTAAPCAPLVVSDVSKGVIANDTNVYGVQLLTAPAHGTLTSYLIASGLNPNGTFTYTPDGTAASDSFTYCANGSVTAGVCSSGITATVSLGASTVTGGVTCTSPSYTSAMATYIKIASPGVLAFCKDSANLPLTVVASSVTAAGVTMDANGGFNATSAGAGTSTFSFVAKNSMGTAQLIHDRESDLPELQQSHGQCAGCPGVQ